MDCINWWFMQAHLVLLGKGWSPSLYPEPSSMLPAAITTAPYRKVAAINCMVAEILFNCDKKLIKFVAAWLYLSEIPQSWQLKQYSSRVLPSLSSRIDCRVDLPVYIICLLFVCVQARVVLELKEVRWQPIPDGSSLSRSQVANARARLVRWRCARSSGAWSCVTSTYFQSE